MRQLSFLVRAALGALLGAIALGAPSLVESASAQTFTSLASEFQAARPLALPAETWSVTGTCDPEEPSTFAYEASGHTGGVLGGTFTEEGSVTIGRNVGTNARGVDAFESTFTIHGDGGIEIVGTKRFLQSQDGNCRDADTHIFSFATQFTYDAVVTGPAGSWNVSGAGMANGTSVTPVETHMSSGLYSFSSVFVTSTPLTPRPGIVFLAPSSADRAVGSEHCVTATVWSSTGVPIPNASVVFSSELVPEAGATAVTDENARAELCYTGPAEPGLDTIRAFADSDDDGVEEPGEPFGTASVSFFVPQFVPVATTLLVEPEDASAQAGGDHCVTATLLDQAGEPLGGVLVRLDVEGTSAGAAAAASTGADGTAQLCYTTAVFPGVDTLRLLADVDEDGAADEGEPVAVATVSLTALPEPPAPASLELDPDGATVEVGGEHCTTATVRDEDGHLMDGVTVRFAVTGASSVSGVETTGADGRATFCYEGPADPGVDTLGAYADADGDGIAGPDEPADVVTIVFTAPPLDTVPASLSLAPKTAIRPVGEQHCVTATVRNAGGQPVEQAAVRFTASGATATAGSAVTDAQGRADLCYVSPVFPGSDAIRAFADADGSGAENDGEPFDTAAVDFVLPANTPGCDVEDKGAITLASGKDGKFTERAHVHADGLVHHKQEFEDTGTRMKLKSLALLSLTCDEPNGRAVVYGIGTVERAPGTIQGVLFRVTLFDGGHPGAGRDRYGIVINTGYASGDRLLKSGEVKFR